MRVRNGGRDYGTDEINETDEKNQVDIVRE